MVVQQSSVIATRGRGTYDITDTINATVVSSGCTTGICCVFIHHTSASLLITENADPSVRGDLETILQRLAPDADPAYQHDYEGDDDMSAHVRCLLTNDSLTIPITDGQCALGTWQGVYVYEHRFAAFQRQLTITIIGD